MAEIAHGGAAVLPERRGLERPVRTQPVQALGAQAQQRTFGTARICRCYLRQSDGGWFAGIERIYIHPVPGGQGNVGLPVASPHYTCAIVNVKAPKRLAGAVQDLHSPAAQHIQLVTEAEHILAGQLQAKELLPVERQAAQRPALEQPEAVRSAAGKADLAGPSRKYDLRAVAHQAVLRRAVLSKIHIDCINILAAGESGARGVRAVIHAHEYIRASVPFCERGVPHPAAG